MRYCKWILASFLATLAGLASATTYTFTGTPYTSASGVFTTSMVVSGSFTTAAPLPPNMPLTEIGPGAATPLVTSWSFFDGVRTYTHTDSQVLFGLTQHFIVATNASGGISDYQIGFMSPTGPHTVGQTMNGVVFNQTSYSATVALCTAVDNSVCTRIVSDGSNVATGNVRGTWVTSETSPSSHPVPATSDAILVLMALGLGLLALRQQRSRFL